MIWRGGARIEKVAARKIKDKSKKIRRHAPVVYGRSKRV